jgi:hypothetical protein
MALGLILETPATPAHKQMKERYFDSDIGIFVIGSLVRINTYTSDENCDKIGLIISGADPWRMDSMAQAIIENWLYRETQDDGYLLEPAYVVRIEGLDYIYSESEMDLINSPNVSERLKNVEDD